MRNKSTLSTHFTSRLPKLTVLHKIETKRSFVENLTAYLFLAPSLLIVGLFGLFPVAFAFFVSMHRWRRLPEGYRGLDPYYEALGDVAFVVFFWLALSALIYAALMLWRARHRLKLQPALIILGIPGALNAAVVFAAVNWFFTLVPIVVNIPTRLRGQPLENGVFVDELIRSLAYPEPAAAVNTLILLSVVAIIANGIALYCFRDSAQRLVTASVAALMAGIGLLLLQVTVSEIQSTVDAARESGVSLPIWTHVILISLGVLLLMTAFRVWQQAIYSRDDQRLFVLGTVALLLMIGGYVLITQLPRALENADRHVLQSLNVTVMYSAFSIPFQLIIGLALAILLFQRIRYRSLFRLLFFLPYVMPAVATSAIFSIVFSNRATAPANQVLAFMGLDAQQWLMDPRGIFQIIFGAQIPDWLAGPGLALVAVLVFNIWTYVGFAAVIFLAGLGNIPATLYEASQIDGATGWQAFRHITLPLLSPTIFFQILIATIGTFQAFTQIWLMRRPGAYDAVDTISIYIFQNVRSAHPDYAYGSALAFVLFFMILVLTLVQNRVLGRWVFYG